MVLKAKMCAWATLLATCFCSNRRGAFTGLLVSNGAAVRLFAERLELFLEELGGTLGDAAGNEQRLATCVQNCFSEEFDINTTGTNIRKHRSLPG